MLKKLAEIADINIGQPIRDKINNIPDGDYFIAQIKDLSKETGLNTATLYRTNIKGRVGPRLLKSGDLLFVSRVFRESLPYSAVVNTDLPDLIAAPTFFIISPDTKLIRPDYLNWFINSETHGGKFFKKNATGSSILNIPKSVLTEMEVSIPSLAKQDQFIKLLQAAKKEKEIMNSIVEKRQNYLNEIINKFLE